MPIPDLEHNIEYPFFTARNYVIAVRDNPDNIPMWSAADPFISRFFLSGSKGLNQILGEWPVKRPELVARMREEEKSTIFDFEKEYTIDLGKNPDGSRIEV